MVLFQARDQWESFEYWSWKGRRVFVSLAKGRGVGEEKFTCLLHDLRLAALGSQGVLLLVWAEPKPSDPKPGTWAWFGTCQIPTGCSAEAGNAEELSHKNLWGGKCLLCVSWGGCEQADCLWRSPEMGCSRGKVGCPLISVESLGLETAENNFVPLCQAALAGFFLEMEAFTVTADFSPRRGDSARAEAQTR